MHNDISVRTPQLTDTIAMAWLSKAKRKLCEKALEHKELVLIVSHGGVYWVVQEI